MAEVCLFLMALCCCYEMMLDLILKAGFAESSKRDSHFPENSRMKDAEKSCSTPVVLAVVWLSLSMLGDLRQ